MAIRYHPNAIIFSSHVVEYLLLAQRASSTDYDYPVPEAAPMLGKKKEKRNRQGSESQNSDLNSDGKTNRKK